MTQTRTDTDRIDAIERFLSWAQGEFSDLTIALELRKTREGRFVVTVIGPDDEYSGTTLRDAIDQGAFPRADVGAATDAVSDTATR